MFKEKREAGIPNSMFVVLCVNSCEASGLAKILAAY